MSRTNIDIDDDAVAQVMARYNLPTKRAAVDFALRQVAGPRVTVDDIDALRGAWRGLDELPVPGSTVPGWRPDADADDR